MLMPSPSQKQTKNTKKKNNKKKHTNKNKNKNKRNQKNKSNLGITETDVNAQNNWGETPLHRAVTRIKGDLLMAELLLQNGADPNLKTKIGETPLHLAVIAATMKKRQENGAKALIELLCFHGADVTVISAKGDTPYAVALKMGLHAAAAQLKKEEGRPEERAN
jgi:ankyrin repeat protein